MNPHFIKHHLSVIGLKVVVRTRQERDGQQVSNEYSENRPCKSHNQLR